MTYDEFKQNFLPEFLNINSYAGRIKYANEHLERIGSGIGRVVYKIDEEKAFKLAKNPKGVAQNETESGIGYDNYAKSIVTEVFEHDDNGTWLVAEFAKKVSEKRIKELTGIPSLNDLFYFLRNTVESNKGSRGQTYGQDQEMKDFFWENEFSSTLVDFVVNYNQVEGDMGRPSSYGEVNRSGQPEIVLTDYGLNDEVYNTHYSPQRKQQYQMYEMFNYADGNDDILSDAGGGMDIRNGMWAQMPYSVSDGHGVINENFIHFVSNRSKYPNKPISGLPVLADGFHEVVNNIKPILKLVENKKQFYSNLLELQNYLTEQGYYDRDPLLSEEYIINEENTEVESDTLNDKNYSNELANEVAGKLGLSSPRNIGGGGNGFAYEIDSNNVLKLTTDISEADAASKLIRGRPKYIGEIYNLYKVVDTRTNKAIFAILQENINDKPLEKFRKYWVDISKILIDTTFEDVIVKSTKRNKFDYNQFIELGKRILTENPEANVSQIDREAAYNYFVGLMNIRQELIDFDIKSNDYTVIGNQGYKNGVLKFFDVGGYHNIPEPNINDDDVISLPEDGSAKFSTDDAIGQDGFPAYNTNDTSPSINNDLDANIAMYEDLEYNHVKGDATDDEYMLGESDLHYSKEDYQRIGDDKIKEFIKHINNYANQIKSKQYLSGEDLTDIKFLIFSMQYNKDRYSEYMGFNTYNSYFKLFYDELKRTKVIAEERNKSFGTGSKTVDVKKKCRIGGLGNTSVACNQGDINNLILKSIKEEIENNLELKEYFSSLVPMNEIKINIEEARNLK